MMGGDRNIAISHAMISLKVYFITIDVYVLLFHFQI